MSIVEMEHIERHLSSMGNSFELYGIQEYRQIGVGLSVVRGNNLLCNCVCLDSYESYYKVYSIKPYYVTQGLQLGLDYDVIDIEKYRGDVDYRFQINSTYNENELIYNIRMMYLENSLSSYGAEMLYFGEFDLRAKMALYKELEQHEDWRKKRL